MRWFQHSRAVDVILLFTISIVATVLWFHNGNLALGGDFASIPFDPQRTASRYLSAWNFGIDAGNPITTIISNQVPPIDFLFYYALHMINSSFSTSQGISIVLFSYFLPAISTYGLVATIFERKLPSSRLAAFVAGIFAILNPIYVYSSGYPAIVSNPVPRASLPLALFLLVAGFKKRDLKYAVAIGLSSALIFSSFARALEIGYLILMSAVFAIPYVVTRLRQRRPLSLHFAGKFLLISFLSAIAVNLYWIVPFLSEYGIFFGELTSFPTTIVGFESQFTTLQNVIRLQGYWTFYVGSYVPYASYYYTPFVWGVTFAIPALIVGGLISARKSTPEVLGLGLLLVLFLALSLGTNLSFNIFTVAIQSVPFFKVYKDPWVFLEPLAIIYSILFGVSISAIAGLAGRIAKRRRLAIIGSVALAVVLLGIISGPVVSGSVFVSWYQPSQKGVSVPAYYAQLNNWLAQDTCNCATMIVPKLSGSYMATSWGYQGPNVLYQNLFSTRLITGSGPAIYGLQPSPEKNLLNYVYTLMSSGDPIFSPAAVNATSQPSNWHFSVQSQRSSDTINAQEPITPWNESTLLWKFGPNKEGAQNGHSIYFRFNITRDLSQQQWVLLWASANVDWSNLIFGIGDSVGNVGWYPFQQNLLFSSGRWDLFGFPVKQPDARSSDVTQTMSFFLNYGLFLGQAQAGEASGVLEFGPALLSTGQVPENLIESLLAGLNVKYIVMDTSLDRNLYPQLDVRPYQIMLSSWHNISLVKTFGTLLVFENPNYASLISVPENWIDNSNLYLLPEEIKSEQFMAGSSAFVSNATSGLYSTSAKVTLESVKQYGPTSFSVQLSGTGIFLIVFSTAFDPNWQATSDGRLLGEHVLADGYANGWLIEGSGAMTIDINYRAQTVYTASLWLSFFSIVSAFVLVLMRKLFIMGRRIAGQLHSLKGR